MWALSRRMDGTATLGGVADNTNAPSAIRDY
jgi:hypothetical protein